MNYRHAYHAGNFADVLKHAVLALVIEHLKLKPAPFRVVDTHAGVGSYDLAAEAAEKTGEWRDGIGRILASPLPADVAPILAPYLDVVRAENVAVAAGGHLARYPGSPLIARRLIRPCDTLVLNELHPEDNASLTRHFAHDPQTRVLAIDGWSALKSLLPPKERRGVVLVDPPFEQPGEFERLADGLAAANRRFATGTLLLWYPVKGLAGVTRFHDTVARLGIAKLLAADLFVRDPAAAETLSGTGLVILNPPYTLHDKLMKLLPFLAQSLSKGRGSGHALTWLTE